jgi:ligand-binding SRPBCC domain-containing protein
MGRVEIVTEIEAPLEKVFAFNADPKSMEKVGPAEYEAKVEITSDRTLGVGTTYHLSATVAGQKMEGDIEITELEENHRVVQRMTSGDFKKLEMTDVFEATDQGTKVTTTWDYELPYSVLGKMLDRLRVGKEIDAAAKAGWQGAKEILEKE